MRAVTPALMARHGTVDLPLFIIFDKQMKGTLKSELFFEEREGHITPAPESRLNLFSYVAFVHDDLRFYTSHNMNTNAPSISNSNLGNT